MLAKRIIPCLDVDRGRVVKGINFVGLRDAGDPVQIAQLVADAAGRYGAQCIVVAIDAKQTGPGASPGIRWGVFTHGGRRPSGLDAVEWARKMQKLGAGEILLTSMDRDGTREGFDLALTRAVAEAVDVPV